MAINADELLDKELFKRKQRIDLLKEAFVFFNAVKKKSIAQDLILDQIEKEIDPLLSKIKVVKPEIK